MRRLPVYVLIDTSESMAGKPLQAMGIGLKALISALKSDPICLETVWFSVITFGGEARQLFPLTEVMNLQPIELRAIGKTSLGSGFRILVDAIAREVVPGNGDSKGDWPTKAFIFIGGVSSDEWLMPAKILSSMAKGKIIDEPVVLALEPGNFINDLKRAVSNIIIDLNQIQPDTFSAFFRWPE